MTVEGIRPLNDHLRGRLLVATAAILWSTSGLFAKAPWFDNWPLESRGVALAFWRALFASLLLVPMVRRPRWQWRLLPMVACFAAMNYTYLNAMTHTTAANAIWLQNTAPTWVLLAGWLVLREPVHRRDVWQIACAALGVAFILCFELRQAHGTSGIAFGLLSGITYAGIVISLRRLRAEEPAFLVALNHASTAAILAPLAVRAEMWPNGHQLAALAAFGMLQLGLPYLLFTRGLRQITGHEAAGIALLEPILVPLWVYLAWRHAANYQAPHWWTWVGAALILTGLVLRYAWPRAVKRET